MVRQIMSDPIPRSARRFVDLSVGVGRCQTVVEQSSASNEVVTSDPPEAVANRCFGNVWD